MTRLSKSRIAVAVVAFVVGATLAAGVAFAAIPNATNGAISACYPTSGPSAGTLRVIDAQKGVTCSTGEALLTWPSRGFKWRGQWQGPPAGPATGYQVNDVVSYSGTVYIAVQANKSRPNTKSSWAVLAASGAVGSPAPVQLCGGYPHEGIDWSKPGSTPGNGCDFTGANLSNRDLANADLTNADLTRANLSNANLSGASLAGANVSGVVWSNTRCPDSTSSDSNGTMPQSCVGHGF